MSKNLIVLDEKQNISQYNNNHIKILEEIKKGLNKDEFNSIVTLDNLDVMKITAKELGKNKALISAFRIAKKKFETSHIDLFNKNFVEYFKLVEKKQNLINEQVAKFEDETKELIKKLMFDYVVENTKDIRIEFSKNLTYLDLVILSAVTGKGALTKKSRDTLDLRIQVCKSKQDKYDFRLVILENICLTRELKPPLTESNILHIINIEDGDKYAFELDTLINEELVKHKKIKENLEEKIRKDAEKAVNDQRNKVDSIFLHPQFGHMELDSLRLLVGGNGTIEKYDISEFHLCTTHAKDMRDRAVDKILQAIYAKEKALQEEKKFVDKVPLDVKECDSIAEKCHNESVEHLSNIEIDEENHFDLGTPNASLIEKGTAIHTQLMDGYDLHKIDKDSLLDIPNASLIDRKIVEKVEPVIVDDELNPGLRYFDVKLHFRVIAPEYGTAEQVKSQVKENLLVADVNDENIVTFEVV